MIERLLFLQMNFPLRTFHWHTSRYRTVPQRGENQNMCSPVIGCTKVWCHIASVQRPLSGKADAVVCLSSGNKSLTPFPDPFPVWPYVCSRVEGGRSHFVPYYYSMFFLIPPFPYFRPVKSCSRWADRAQHTARGGPGNVCPPVQKHVLTVCATSGGIFTPKAILLCTYIGTIFARPAKAKHILLKWKQNKKKDSYYK